jgi:hypothetical protein
MSCPTLFLSGSFLIWLISHLAHFLSGSFLRLSIFGSKSFLAADDFGRQTGLGKNLNLAR